MFARTKIMQFNVTNFHNKQLCHETFCLENKVLHLLLYYELKYIG